MDSDGTSFTEETLTESSTTDVSPSTTEDSTGLYDSTTNTSTNFSEETLTSEPISRTPETQSSESYTSLVTGYSAVSEDYSTQWSQDIQIDIPEKLYKIHRLKTEDQKRLDRFDSKYKDIMQKLRVRPITKAPCSQETDKRYPVKFYDNVRLQTLTTIRDDTLRIPIEVKKELEYQHALSKLRSQR